MKVIDVAFGNHKNVCNFCVVTTDEDVKQLHYVGFYHCICPRQKPLPTFEDIIRQFITEPCTDEDFVICPIAIANEKRMNTKGDYEND